MFIIFLSQAFGLIINTRITINSKNAGKVLINNYLKSNRIKKNFVNLTEILKTKSKEKSSSLMIGGFQNVLDNEFDFTKDSVFYHNPFQLCYK